MVLINQPKNLHESACQHGDCDIVINLANKKINQKCRRNPCQADRQGYSRDDNHNDGRDEQKNQTPFQRFFVIKDPFPQKLPNESANRIRDNHNKKDGNSNDLFIRIV